jgi:hypothetical protein
MEGRLGKRSETIRGEEWKVKESGVAPFKLTRAGAERRIRELADNDNNIIWGEHAQQRMAERDIEDVVVLRVLRCGYVDTEPELTEYNEWQCKVTLKVRGSRVAGVVTIILHNGRLFVKTVEWEDPT